jgi:hypothetical protein
MDIKQVNSAIMFGNFTNTELNSILDAVKYARGQLARQQARTLRAGDAVKFTSNKNGVTYQGTLEKVKLKYAIVKTQHTRYNVPLSMLTEA